MSDLVPADFDAVQAGQEADLVVVEDEFGTALVGDDSAIKAFVRDWDITVSPVPVDAGTALRQTHTQLFSTRSVTAAYGIAKSAVSLGGRSSKTTVTYHRMVRDKYGTIRSHTRIAPPTAAAVMPQLLALTALEMAMNAQFDAISEQLDVIEDKVDEVLRLASAERVGDVYGHHRLLSRRVQAVASGDALTATDWSSIAALGADLEVGVERLRMHAFKQLETLDVGAGPGKRADQLDAMMRKNRLGETLQLLVVAQKSLFLWQQLRLEQVRIVEAEHLDQTIMSARATLREHYLADVDLVARLREALDTHAVLRIAEAHHKLAARSMTKRRQDLSELLDRFGQARNLQLAQWDGSEHATLSEALAAAKTKTAAILNSSRRQLASWIEPAAETPKQD
ncbi:hypothetical protein AB0J48_26230 [Nocardia salmonicida]|uniref:hypothetical protein n=1 Tax=Nocardia salmonicida TaxID=53431 RepID=UPI00341F783E